MGKINSVAFMYAAYDKIS